MQRTSPFGRLPPCQPAACHTAAGGQVAHPCRDGYRCDVVAQRPEVVEADAVEGALAEVDGDQHVLLQVQ
jgi:hypothetical protein